jgi:spore maturation protein SpmB
MGRAWDTGPAGPPSLRLGRNPKPSLCNIDHIIFAASGLTVSSEQGKEAEESTIICGTNTRVPGSSASKAGRQSVQTFYLWEQRFHNKVIVSPIEIVWARNMPVKLINAQGLSDVAHGLTIAALIVFFLYLAGVIVQPLAIAALLSFILAPVMRRLRIWGLPKVVSALFSVALTLTAIGALGTTLVMQGRQLAEDLPKYENNLRAKIQGLSGAPIASGVLERASGTLNVARSAERTQSY